MLSPSPHGVSGPYADLIHFRRTPQRRATSDAPSSPLAQGLAIPTEPVPRLNIQTDTVYSDSDSQSTLGTPRTPTLPFSHHKASEAVARSIKKRPGFSSRRSGGTTPSARSSSAGCVIRSNSGSRFLAPSDHRVQRRDEMPKGPKISRSDSAVPTSSSIDSTHIKEYPSSVFSSVKPRKNSTTSRSVAGAPLTDGEDDPTSRPPSPAGSLLTLVAEQDELAELKALNAKWRAREACFVERNGSKLHRYPVREVPYPRSYNKDVLDLDVWSVIWSEQCSGGLTWHQFDTPPLKVLDLGCGTGSWVLEAASQWKDTHFVGLDIVPIQPDLDLLHPELASRVTWVRANFLDAQLPFEDGEFDFVNSRRIGRGIPEDRWDPMLEEISRILKPGGAFQCAEEDLYFPGSLDHRSLSQEPIVASPSPKAASRPPSPSTRPRAPTPLSIPSDPSNASLPNSSGSEGSGSSSMAPVNPHDHSLLEFIYNEMHSARFINLAPISVVGSAFQVHFTGMKSHTPIIVMFPPSPDTYRSVMGELNMGDRTSGARLQRLYQSSRSAEASDIEAAAPDSEVSWQRVIRLDLARTELSASPFLSPTQLVQRTAHIRTDQARVIAQGPRSTAAPHRFPMPVSKQSGSYNDASWMESSLSPEEKRSSQLMRFDIRTLNLHLSLRTKEILACAEAMWDYIVDFQRDCSPQLADGLPVRGRFSRHYSDAVAAQLRPLTPATLRTMVMNLTRPDFDALLLRYKL
ncbi:uncharacterized protein FIBRA_03604 [Fibroporia radiculosa]|uniref:Methyltransferase domain-containing protein n=1 Tax=Fibroporia radiculosa TaxID=599839 RepID=J4I9Q0_9APHY|nr:uncharacterized protein FIBRA_03604 [Fibroporia radiculosa]CCM01546.1 predicted protein [Fibroporia radiculosa]